MSARWTDLEFPQSLILRVNDNYYRLRVLSGISARYGAATAQILAIYENFLAFAVSVLLLANPLF